MVKRLQSHWKLNECLDKCEIEMGKVFVSTILMITVPALCSFLIALYQIMYVYTRGFSVDQLKGNDFWQKLFPLSWSTENSLVLSFWRQLRTAVFKSCLYPSLVEWHREENRDSRAVSERSHSDSSSQRFFSVNIHWINSALALNIFSLIISSCCYTRVKVW